MQDLLTKTDYVLVTKAACKAASSLGLKRREFAGVIGVSEPSISRFKNGSCQIPEGKSFELSLMLIDVYRSLYAIVGGDILNIKHWMQTPNKHLQLEAPLHLLQRADGIGRLAQYLDVMRVRS